MLEMPLKGIRVLDFSQNLPGPYATMILASLGAEVIKVEPPKGDASRYLRKLFEMLNKGKKSISVDLKQESDRLKIKALLADIDILVEGFRPGTMGKFGLDATSVHDENSNIIYCSISGFGQKGNYAQFPSHDLNLQALSGAAYMARNEQDEPMSHAIPIADFSSSMTAITAILAALYQREKGGSGVVLDISLSETLFSWAYIWSEGLSPQNIPLKQLKKRLNLWLKEKRNPSKNDKTKQLLRLPTFLRNMEETAISKFLDQLESGIQNSKIYNKISRLGLHSLPHYNIFKTKDGRYLSLAVVDEDRFWRAFCEKANLKPFASIPFLGRFLAATPLHTVLVRTFRKKTLAQWIKTLDVEDIPFTPVFSPQEALENEQLQLQIKNNMNSILPLFSFLEDLKAPKIGEHNDIIFVDDIRY